MLIMQSTLAYMCMLAEKKIRREISFFSHFILSDAFQHTDTQVFIVIQR